MLTTPQAAEKAGISHRAICYAIEDGRLPARRIGRDWTIDEADFEGFVAGREAGTRRRARPLAVALSAAYPDFADECQHQLHARECLHLTAGHLDQQ